MKNIIILMGGQGVGKGTFSRMLRETHDFNYIETGALFRSLPKDSEIAKIMATGALVPDSELFKLIESKVDDSKDIIIDGFPRTLGQAQWLVENYSKDFAVKVIYLDVPEEIMTHRIQKRLNEGGGRADDINATTVRRRLDAFWNTTMPAIKWLETANGIKFTNLDVTGHVDDNFARILSALKD